MNTTLFILWVFSTGGSWHEMASFRDYDACMAAAERYESLAFCLSGERVPWHYLPVPNIPSWSGQPRLEEAI